MVGIARTLETAPYLPVVVDFRHELCKCLVSSASRLATRVPTPESRVCEAQRRSSRGGIKLSQSCFNCTAGCLLTVDERPQDVVSRYVPAAKLLHDCARSPLFPSAITLASHLRSTQPLGTIHFTSHQRLGDFGEPPNRPRNGLQKSRANLTASLLASLQSCPEEPTTHVRAAPVQKHFLPHLSSIP